MAAYFVVSRRASMLVTADLNEIQKYRLQGRRHFVESLWSEVSGDHQARRLPDSVTWALHHPRLRVGSYTAGKKGHVRFPRRLTQKHYCLLNYHFVQLDL